MKLNQQYLADPHLSLKLPDYDRTKLKPGMVHVGVGGFHRAHQGYVMQQLLQERGHEDWGICGVGIRTNDRQIADVFEIQDCLYTLITRDPAGTISGEVMGQMINFLYAPEDKAKVIAQMAHPDTKIVSLTITEGGYNLKPDGTFDVDNPGIQHDFQNPDDPNTIYGYLAASLSQRRARKIAPYTIMSCDNIQQNGDVTRKMFLSFLKLSDSELASWVAREVAFPNSMVDRITPVTTKAETDFLLENYDLEDQWPVTCEPFLQWVIEDHFSNGRPDFSRYPGVQFVTDVTPYETMKIRLLNAGHSVLGIFGALLGISTINACMKSDLLVQVLKKFWQEEATPTLAEVDGIDFEEYRVVLEQRFANPNIKDQVSRICSESSAKFPKFLVPTINDNISMGGSIEISAWVVAAWCYYSDKQVDQAGNALEIIDEKSEELHAAATATSEEVLSFLRIKSVFGDLMENSVFTNVYVSAIKQFHETEDVGMLLSRLVTKE